MLNRFCSVALAAGLAVGMLPMATGCGGSPAPRTQEGRQLLRDEARLALQRMEREDPGLRDFLNNRAHAYILFPDVGKGGLLVGGAYGRGVAFRQGEAVGFAELNQANVGLLIGGQSYAEVLAFEREADFAEFRNRGEFTLGANASATFLKAGVAAKTNFQNGVAVFVMPKAGLMADLSIAGQQINFSQREPQDRRNQGTQAGDEQTRTQFQDRQDQTQRQRTTRTQTDRTQSQTDRARQSAAGEADAIDAQVDLDADRDDARLDVDLDAETQDETTTPDAEADQP